MIISLYQISDVSGQYFSQYTLTHYVRLDCSYLCFHEFDVVGERETHDIECIEKCDEGRKTTLSSGRDTT